MQSAASDLLSTADLDAAAERHACYAAYECLLLASGVAHDPSKEHRRHDIISRLRPRLDVKAKEHDWLLQTLRSVPLPASAEAVASGGHRAALLGRLAAGADADARAAAFLKRQQTLVRVAGAAATALPTPIRARAAASSVADDATSATVVIEGWLDMQPHKLGPAFMGRRRDTWVPRYFVLFTDGKLTWAPEAPAHNSAVTAAAASSPQMRSERLTARVVTSLASDRALHVSGIKPVLVLQAPGGDAHGIELLRQWQQAIETHKASAATRAERGTSRGSLGFGGGRISSRVSLDISGRKSVATTGGRKSVERRSEVGGGGRKSVEGRSEAGGGVEVEATPWPPRFAFAMYCELVKAAAFLSPAEDLDADYDGGEWRPEQEPDRSEALALLRCVWAPLRISEHAHAAAVLQVTADFYSQASPNTEASDALLDALGLAVTAALTAQARHAAHASTARRKVDAVREAAARLRQAGRNARKRGIGEKVHSSSIVEEPREEPAESRQKLLDEQRATVAAALIQRSVVNSILSPQTAHGEPAEVTWWVSERLTAILAGAASNLADRLEDYRLLDDSRELPKMIRIWHSLTLAAVVLRHDPSSLAELISEGVGLIPEI